jgi:hypothetical protein
VSFREHKKGPPDVVGGKVPAPKAGIRAPQAGRRLKSKSDQDRTGRDWHPCRHVRDRSPDILADVLVYIEAHLCDPLDIAPQAYAAFRVTLTHANVHRQWQTAMPEI